MLLPNGQKLVHDGGTHIARAEQHELTIHTEPLDEQRLPVLLHGSKIEHSIAGIQ